MAESIQHLSKDVVTNLCKHGLCEVEVRGTWDKKECRRITTPSHLLSGTHQINLGLLGMLGTFVSFIIEQVDSYSGSLIDII